MPEIEYDGIEKLVAEIQKGELTPCEYAHMIRVFIFESEENDETDLMAFALAKQAVQL